MIPDFSKNTKEILAKRASFICSNPDCRVNTVGPNSDPEKSTKIGEAAHIYGARDGSKRYIPNMTDSARAEITNSIWLCRNCHKLIDTDEHKYSPNVLFVWREKHENYIASTLGNKNDRILHEEQLSILSDFDGYPPIIKRIIIDKPEHWDLRLAAELMKFLNDPLFRKLKDLEDGLYLGKFESIESKKVFKWLSNQIIELQTIYTTPRGLFKRFSKSLGVNREYGDIKEIHHITKLLRDYLKHVVSFEEKFRFVIVPEEYKRYVQLHRNLIGSQVEKLSSIPNQIEENLSSLDKPKENTGKYKAFTIPISFELPTNFNKQLEDESQKILNELKALLPDEIEPIQKKEAEVKEKKKSNGCLIVVVVVLIFLILYSLI